MMRALYRLRLSVALLICPELALDHDGGTVQGAPGVPVGANATEEAAKALCVVPLPKWTGAPVPKPARKDGFVDRAAERARRQKDINEAFAATPRAGRPVRSCIIPVEVQTEPGTIWRPAQCVDGDLAFSVARSVLTTEMAARFRVWIEAALSDQSPYRARRALRLEREGEAPVQDPSDQQFMALQAAWNRAGAKARSRFLDRNGIRLIEMLGLQLGVELPARQEAAE